MRPLTRAFIGAAACTPLLLAFPATASAAGPSDVTFAFEVDGSTVTNTITNNSGLELDCATSLAPAPGGVHPPILDVIDNGQNLGSSDDAGEPGTSTQSVVDIPDGHYVALASCGTDGVDPAVAWISDYPGLRFVLPTLPWDSYAVQQASPIVAIGDVAPIPDPAPILGSADFLPIP